MMQGLQINLSENLYVAKFAGWYKYPLVELCDEIFVALQKPKPIKGDCGGHLIWKLQLSIVIDKLPVVAWIKQCLVLFISFANDHVIHCLLHSTCV